MCTCVCVYVKFVVFVCVCLFVRIKETQTNVAPQTHMYKHTHLIDTLVQTASEVCEDTHTHESQRHAH